MELPTIQRLTREFRVDAIEDVLGIDMLVWHTWFSVEGQRSILSKTINTSLNDLRTTSNPAAKRSPDSIAAHQQKKKHRKNKEQPLQQQPTLAVHHCPDPECAADTKNISFTWEGLYDHMKVFFSATLLTSADN